MTNAAREAAEVLNRSAVSFETDRKWNNQSAWPFWYPFIPKPYLDTDILYNGMGLLGITIRPGEIREIPIQIDRDTVYRLINIKHQVLRCSLGDLLTGTITAGTTTAVVGVGTAFTTELVKGAPIAFLNDAGRTVCGIVDVITDNTNLTLEQIPKGTTTANTFNKALYVDFDTSVNTVVPHNTFHFNPLINFLKVSYIMTSLRSRYLLGGTQVFPTSVDTAASGMQERPLPISALQGHQMGLGQLRTEALFGYDTSFKIKFTNDYDEDLIVNGNLFGYKIAGGESL